MAIFRFLLFVTTLCVSANLAFADCKLEKATYTDGSYNLKFYRSEAIDHLSLTILPFKLTNKEFNISFYGSVVYGNGYSVPSVTIDFCNATEKSVDERPTHHDSCIYRGNLYRIDGDKTRYFNGRANDEKSLFFPDLNFKIYYAVGTIERERKDLPLLLDAPLLKDVWTYKECADK